MSVRHHLKRVGDAGTRERCEERGRARDPVAEIWGDRLKRVGVRRFKRVGVRLMQARENGARNVAELAFPSLKFEENERPTHQEQQSKVLQPKPQKPKPSTLNTQPLTLHPEPETLDPKP